MTGGLVAVTSCKKEKNEPVIEDGPVIEYDSVSDIEGNTYNSVIIGTQTWMAENLKTSKFNDGTSIPQVSDNIAWRNLISSGYCWYNNDKVTNGNTYGALYNWYATSTTTNGSRNVCPTGWHIPTDTEWTILTTYLEGESIAGGKLKETGTTHWFKPNTGATNISGFTALPGGGRIFTNVSGAIIVNFSYYGTDGLFWSSTESDSLNAFASEMSFADTLVRRSTYDKKYGLSVRCLMDN